MFRLIPRDRAAKREDDGDGFLEEDARRFDNLTAGPHHAARVNATVIRATDASSYVYAPRYFAGMPL